MTVAPDDNPEVFPTPPEPESTNEAAASAQENAMKAPTKKVPAKNAPAKKPATKTATKATPAKTAAPAKTTAAKTTAVKTTTAKTTAAKTPAAKNAVEKTAAAKAAQAAETAKVTNDKVVAAKATAAKAAAVKKTTTKTAAEKAQAAKVAAAKRAATNLAKEKAARERAELEAQEAEALARAVSAHEASEGAPLDEVEDSREIRTSTVVRADADTSVVTEVAAPDAKVHREPVTFDEGPVASDEGQDGDDDVATEISAESAGPEASVVENVAVTDGALALQISNLSKSFGDLRAINDISLSVPTGSFYGIVGPNGAGKTTTLSVVAGLLRADSGEVRVAGMPHTSRAAKRSVGVLPDRLRTFDRLTGRQLLYYYGLLRGLSADVVEKRTADLARAFDLTAALSRVVSDYSAGMTKKIMLAGALIHSPRLLVLDEPFESVDPVSSGIILDILRAYVDHGGTVILSSHGMDLVERVCSRIAVIVGGAVLAEGTVDEVRAGRSLEQRFTELAGGSAEVEGLEWLHTFSG